MFYLLHFWCSTLHSIKSAQHCLYNSGKGRCTRYMWSNDMFVLWNRISAIFYEDRKYCLHIFPWFLTSWTFRITSLLNLNEYQCYHHLDLSMIEGFHGFIMFSLSYSKIDWILFRNAKETWKRCWPENIHIVGRKTFEGLKININSIIETTQFLLWHQVKCVLKECFF